MSKHMFRCVIGPGPMSQADLETRINTWVGENDEWTEDTAPHELTQTNTKLDGTGTDYWKIDVRFNETDTKANILQKFTDKLVNKVAWYRVGYHACTHDEVPPTECAWDDTEEWTDKDVTIPADVPSFTVPA